MNQCVDQYEETKKKLHRPLFRPESLPEVDGFFRRPFPQPSHPTSSIKIRAVDNPEAFLDDYFHKGTVRLEYSEVDLDALISIRAKDNPKVFLGDNFRKATVRPESSEADELDNLDALDSELGE